jgi:hypothetical protein
LVSETEILWDLLVSYITNACYVLQRLLELNFLPINLYKALNQD